MNRVLSPEAKMFRLTIVLAAISTALALPQLRSVPTLDGRIVGGQDADIKDYSYQLSLLFLGSHICGAATISSTWALTAAHCLEGISVVSLLTVRAGSSIRNSGGQVVSVLSATSHPSYSRSTMDYDIAALLLASSIGTGYSTPISLPSSGTGPSAGATATVTGWGTTVEEGNLADTLQVVQVPIVSQADCLVAYGSRLGDRMFCAGVLETGGKDACQGDSGGPLVVGGILTGLVSWGDGCARGDSPGVYTNLPVLRTWITSITGL